MVQSKVICDYDEVCEEYESLKQRYEDIKEEYEGLKNEFNNYKCFHNNNYQQIIDRNEVLEKKLDSISNIVEISKYINSNISNDNLLPMINDMIIGILGVTYSSIYLREDEKLVLKASNVGEYNFANYDEEFMDKINRGESFVIACDNSIICKMNNRTNIRSVIGVPVVLGNKFIGYIIVEHGFQDFFSNDHIKFITSIAHQIAIALENSILYKRVKDASIKDSLLKIFNRGHFFELIEHKIITEPEKDFAIVMLDADNFKKTNDVYGHQFGDEALIMLADTVMRNVEEDDIVARYGGEEIIIYIKDVSDRNLVYKKIDYIRKCISENLMKHNEELVSITASFGISYYDNKHRELKEVLKLADTMLYCAKNNGKNIVVSV